MLTQVTDNPSLARNLSTNAIINIDKDGYISYITNKKRINNQSEKINGLEEQVTILSTELSKIKTLLENISK